MILKLYDVCFMKHIFIAPWTCLHRFDLHIIIRWPENVRRVNNICLHCGHFLHCYILLNFVLFVLEVHDSLWLLIVHSCHYRTCKSYFCFVSTWLIPLFHILLNFVGQHHAAGISYTSINNNGYFQGIDALCKHTWHLTHKIYTFSSGCRWSVKFSHVYISAKEHILL